MKIGARDAWVLRRLLCGREPAAPGAAEEVRESERARPLGDLLRGIEPEHRLAAWKGFLTGRKDRDEWSAPVAEADPAAAPPDPGEGVPTGPANIADVRRMFASTRWPWPGWLAGGSLNSLASDPGVGKTIVAMNLARLLWNGSSWPDGQPNAMPAKTRTLWVPGDRHFDQLIGLAERYGLPEEAMLLNAPPESPTTGMDLDDPENLAALEAHIREAAPGLVIVDTVGMTTEKNLCRAEEAKAYFSPLMEMAALHRVAFLMITHLNRDAQALGRRIVGASRVVWKLTKPDPEGQPDRRRFWVDKSYMPQPPALGMTIGADGCTFDDKPPAEPKGGRPPIRQEECTRWLRERLTSGPVSIKEIRSDAGVSGFNLTLLYRAREELRVEEVSQQGKRCWSIAGADSDDESLF